RIRFLYIGPRLRSPLPPHGRSPFRSCGSLRSGWSPFGGTSTRKTAPMLGAQDEKAPPLSGRGLHRVALVRGLAQPFALSASNGPGSEIIGGLVPPPKKSSVRSYMPNAVTSPVPFGSGWPSAPPFTPMAFMMLTKYLLIGALAIFASVPVEPVVPLTWLPLPLHTDSLLPGCRSAEPSHTFTAWPVLK